MTENTTGPEHISRRRFLKVAAAAAGGVCVGAVANHWMLRLRQPVTNVTICKAGSYDKPLAALIKEGLQGYPAVLARARGGRVVLKPNLVEYLEQRPVNTNPAVVAAAAEAFRSLGAREVLVAEGPGHQRDTEMLLEQSGLDEMLRTNRLPFVDLNLDAIHPVKLSSNLTRLDRLFFPATILGADLVVSLAKLKTHHWVGATLSLKNMFGLVPGVKYGWPKNLLHWRGIEQSIVDINTAIRPGFAIIDGVVGMEGDGPLRGEPVNAGVLIMGDNLTAVDATAVRVMGMRPERIPYLLMMMPHGGTVNRHRIRQVGETITAVQQDFAVLEKFAHLKQPDAVRDFIRGV